MITPFPRATPSPRPAASAVRPWSRRHAGTTVLTAALLLGAAGCHPGDDRLWPSIRPQPRDTVALSATGSPAFFHPLPANVWELAGGLTLLLGAGGAAWVYWRFPGLRDEFTRLRDQADRLHERRDKSTADLAQMARSLRELEQQLALLRRELDRRPSYPPVTPRRPFAVPRTSLGEPPAAVPPPPPVPAPALGGEPFAPLPSSPPLSSSPLSSPLAPPPSTGSADADVVAPAPLGPGVGSAVGAPEMPPLPLSAPRPVAAVGGPLVAEPTDGADSDREPWASPADTAVALRGERPDPEDWREAFEAAEPAAGDGSEAPTDSWEPPPIPSLEALIDAINGRGSAPIQGVTCVELEIAPPEEDATTFAPLATRLRRVASGGRYLLVMEAGDAWLFPTIDLLEAFVDDQPAEGIFHYLPDSTDRPQLTRPAMLREVGGLWEVTDPGEILVPTA